MQSPLQQLESSRFHWWNIKRIYIDEVAYLQLDQRHISQNWELDKLARLERRRELAGESYAQAAKEAMRKKSAERELLESEFEYRTFLCELDSRNGEKIKCRQCGVTQPLDDYFHSGCLECGYIDMESAQQN
ncbi:hypothetical protein KW441_14050 [Vibrio fluvialis]|nr:hypothetical protein [Vibrio fluvialis]